MPLFLMDCFAAIKLRIAQKSIDIKKHRMARTRSQTAKLGKLAKFKWYHLAKFKWWLKMLKMLKETEPSKRNVGGRCCEGRSCVSCCKRLFRNSKTIS